MRHRLGYKKLNRTSEHRKALIKNMLNNLIKYEQIVTTLPKAKVLKVILKAPYSFDIVFIILWDAVLLDE